MHNLVINDLPEEGLPTALFEPSELIDFKIAWDWQRKWQEKLLAEPSNKQAVWMLEHFDCYTLGRGASEDNLLFDVEKPPIDFYRIDRGGDVTHHLPGQLVVYLVLDLRRYKTDLDWYLRQLENVLLDVLDGLGLNGYRINGMTGVWCNGKKVASIGISCRRWITQHGIALNVDCDLLGFNQIVPCGLKDYQTGRLNSWLPKLQMKEVRFLMKKSLNKRFGLLWI
ncbi:MULTISPECIES: lipoyl(octanoyl) transferase LipB [Prochlorococcus]|uniref:Octanoyltransferase n=1 Tax=Prochlorococcus marinus (strain SARG / CCMP1375 / SS120) TaxID=167539 RepID=LIPB_PROMA|nr:MULTISPECIES: lipoyl(octanoyl) transferase LipB [Prochlorococcus]Q7VDH8.1 RecName: Full=Octanoyltransferase; AltName: Full=Lipoate-protein ligase B; AltName: Full=Lipoyl/octanoyl transferase; AltName: Full=Octanoyl-[acyl-carrier-protein]-protein N-octanoyltransferase [Prochlorococcus marinus subsp. marinus str. CCMP1375]AAP99444.1 Lipoate-protein ligase B [Prochlorococcus marinus subsp. marinus str. CCMP1375]KGG11287.1 Octanoate-(acyl-carrier-protein)-protein-N-octan oyltransferase [Prochloro